MTTNARLNHWRALLAASRRGLLAEALANVLGLVKRYPMTLADDWESVRSRATRKARGRRIAYRIERAETRAKVRMMKANPAAFARLGFVAEFKRRGA